MNNIGGSLLLLLVALVLLYLAVTDRLSRLIDAWDVVNGSKQTTNSLASNSGAPTVATGVPTGVTLSLPSLPILGNNAQVQA